MPSLILPGTSFKSHSNAFTREFVRVFECMPTVVTWRPSSYFALYIVFQSHERGDLIRFRLDLLLSFMCCCCCCCCCFCCCLQGHRSSDRGSCSGHHGAQLGKGRAAAAVFVPRPAVALLGAGAG